MKNKNKLAFMLAWKELFYNKISTSLIVLVVAAICLPLILLTSIKEGYIDLMRNRILGATQALRVDVSVSNASDYDNYFTYDNIATFKQNEIIDEVVPSRSPRDISIITNNGNSSDFEMLATQPTDPDLKKMGFVGTFGEEDVKHELSIIIHEKDLKNLQYDSTNNIVDIAIKRRVLPCKLIGVLTKGRPGKVYIPLTMEDKLERWDVGYSVVFDQVNPNVTLPSSKDKEDALKEPEVDSVILFTDMFLEKSSKSLLGELEYTYYRNENYKPTSIAQYIIKTEESIFTMSESELIKSTVTKGQKTAILPAEPLVVEINNKGVSLHPSTTNDIRENHLINKKSGQWLNAARNKFEVVLPKGILELGTEAEIVIGSSKVRLKCVGYTADEISHGFIYQKTLLRLQQVANNEADLVGYKYFQPKGETPYESRYLYARAHASDLEQVENVVKLFEEKGYEIQRSSVNQVKDLKSINSMFSKFTNLINIVGLLGCIMAIFVLMYEAIKRKEKQIGIMRAMGLTTSFINRTLIYQSIFYAVCGLALSLLFYTFLTFFLDNQIGHSLLALQGLDGKLTKLSPIIITGFFFGMIVIATISGYSVTRKIEKINPADILAD